MKSLLALLGQYKPTLTAIAGIAITVVAQHYAGAWWLPIVIGAGGVGGVHLSYTASKPPAPPVP